MKKKPVKKVTKPKKKVTSKKRKPKAKVAPIQYTRRSISELYYSPYRF